MKGDIKMDKKGFVKFVNASKLLLKKRSPEILTGVGIAGMITTTVLAVKATPKALQLIEADKKERLNVTAGCDFDGDVCIIQDEKLKPIDIVKVAWKPYIPAAVTGIMSVACLIGASSVNLKRNAAIATAYKLTETAFTEYKEKVVETIGEQKERAVRDEIDKERIEKNPVSSNSVIVTGKGNTLCHDVITGRYFESDIDLINKAINKINRKMLNNEYVSLNEFYNELGVKQVPLGDELGWRIDHGYIDASFSSHIADDGRPCIVLGYSVAPVRDYYKFA